VEAGRRIRGPRRLALSGDALQEKCPVARMDFPDGHQGWLVTSYPEVRSLLADPEFSARQELHHHAPYDHPFGKEPIRRRQSDAKLQSSGIRKRRRGFLQASRGVHQAKLFRVCDPHPEEASA
jgi:hypothetical protein